MYVVYSVNILLCRNISNRLIKFYSICMKNIILIICHLITTVYAHCQGLKKIDIETYYVADSLDEGKSGLPKNAVSYRIFAELEHGYSLQVIFGFPLNPVIIGSTTGFYNHNWGGDIGDMIEPLYLNANNLAFDSWLTIGVATKSHLGIALKEDIDGSIVSKESLKEVDGLFKSDIPQIFKYNLDLKIFEYGEPEKILFADNGLIAVLGGFVGPTSNNKILLAQLTTDGELFFQFNIQLGTPDGNFVQYVARNPGAGQIQFNGLSYGNIPDIIIEKATP